MQGVQAKATLQRLPGEEMNVDDILNGPDYFTCEHYSVRMNKKGCIDRQDREEDIRSRQNPNTVLAHNLQHGGCANCAQGAQIREEMSMPSRRGICVKCKKERALPAKDMCYGCLGYGQNKKTASGGGRKVEKKPKPASVPAEMSPEKVKRLKELKTKIRARLAEKVSEKEAVAVNKLPDPLPIAKIEGEAAILLSPDLRIVILDFSLPENADLFEPWLKYGRSHRRCAGDQAMMAVEEILTKEGLI